jgi:glycerophosphoryl diester phosphodiesterase
MLAFDLCKEHNIVGIELDVHMCKSGELVIIHDHHLGRLCNLDAVVEELRWEQLKRLDVGSFKGAEFTGATIPLLSELFEKHHTHFIYDIELKTMDAKDGQLALKVWQCIQTYHLQEHVLISSFNPFVIRQFNRLSGNTIPTGTIYSLSKEVPPLLRRGWGRYIARPSVLKPHWELVNPKRVSRYPIITWTVDDPKQAKALAQMNVAGIISNDPLKLLGI